MHPIPFLRRLRVTMLPFGLAAWALSGHVTRANSYASSLTNTGGLVSFRLNDAADDVKVIGNAGTLTNGLGPRPRGLTVTNLAGFGMTGGVFKVVAVKIGLGAVSLIGSNVVFNSPRGVAVNVNPASPRFGRVYVANSVAGTRGDGIFIFGADLSDTFNQGLTAKTGGITNFANGGANSPFRLQVGRGDDMVYICDWSDATGNLFVTDPDVTNSPITPYALKQLSGTAVVPVGSNNVHGSVAAVEVLGSLGAGTLQIVTIDEDYQSDPTNPVQTQDNSVWRYNVGAGPLPWSNAPNFKLLTPTISTNSQTMDLAYGPANGFWYVLDRRISGDAAGVFVVDSSGNVRFNSHDESLAEGNTNDFLADLQGVSASPDGLYLAVINNANVITIVPLTNGIPNLPARFQFTGFGTTGNARAIAFDRADNLYMVSSGLGILQCLSLGFTATNTTGSDGTFTQQAPPPGAVPRIVVQPASISATQGQTVVLSVTAYGAAPLAYYWGTACPLDDPRWPNCGCGPFPPCYPSLPTLTLPGVVPDNAGGYYVVLSNAFGVATSQVATLTVTNPTPVRPLISSSGASAQTFTLSFQSLVGYLYEVQYENALSTPAWNTLTTLLATGVVTTVQDTLATTSARLYRVLNRGPVTAPLTAFEPPEPAPARPGIGGPPGSSGVQVCLYTGEFQHSETDLVIKGRGTDFVWTRQYRSRSGATTTIGNGWDFSYNLRVQPDGTGFDVFDGTGRQDTYQLQADGTYGVDGIFCEGSLSNLAFTLKFPDAGTWEFLPLDGSPSAGKILHITDRNGNLLSFTYDGVGRLTNIVDTLNRSIRVTYNADGFISAVTDFTGRQVAYSYYQNSDTNGSFGDLKSVTSPVVTNTPNGNDFPAGKITVYTYTRGQSDDRLNHNLLSITDGKGQTWLRNTYDLGIIPSAPTFDHLLKQTRGYSNQVLNFTYKAQLPLAGNQFAVSKAIVNDRVGNVSEYLFDANNRLVRRRQFAGRAVTGTITTETANRPTNKLRSTDPDYFETRYDWNADSRLTRTVYPNGNSLQNTYESALNPNASRRFRGNLRARASLPGPLGGDQAAITESFVYDTSFGGCCGFNFVTQYTDGRLNTTYHAYDSHGNRTNTIHQIPTSTESWEYNAFGQVTAHDLPDNGSGSRRRDTYAYYASGPQNGYLQKITVDANGLGLATTFEYDAVGNIVRQIDARTNDTLYTYNALDQLVRERSREVTPGSGIRYDRLYWYDANNNLARVDIENRDQAGVLQTNTAFTTIYDYEILNRRTRVTQELFPVDLTNSVISYNDIPVPSRAWFIYTDYTYDANRNPLLQSFPVATSGVDPFNTVQTLYDERDLLLFEIRAPAGPVQSTTQTDYDGNGNLVRTVRGLESAPRTNAYAYDGFNRLVRTLDPMGNTKTNHYDANNNLASERSDGEIIDVPGSAGNVRLAEVDYTYDAMDRLIRRDDQFFEPQTQSSIGDGQATTTYTYSPNSQLLSVTDDNSNRTAYAYDSLNRLLLVTDAKSNSVGHVYDPNSNLVLKTNLDRPDVPGQTNESFNTQYAYDGLDRLIRTLDAASNTTQQAYDSRNNLTTKTNARGNVVIYQYDALNRLVETDRLQAGITNRRSWDNDSRLWSQSDGNNNVTPYAYDSLDRLVTTWFADGTSNSIAYDVQGNAISRTDANGTTVYTTYDLLDRPTVNQVYPAPGVLGTTNETYSYDGLSRVVETYNQMFYTSNHYDSLSHLVSEFRTLPIGYYTVGMEYDGVGNLIRVPSYPFTGRTLVQSFDALNRLKVSQYDNATNAVFQYTGPDRIARVEFGNGTRMDVTYDRDALPQTIQHGPAGSPFYGRRLSWDPAHNLVLSSNLFGADYRQYHYDAAERLTATDDSLSASTTTYALDAVGNRTSVNQGPGAGVYSMDSNYPDPADSQMNQYSIGPGGTARAYDANGNLIAANGHTFSYDFRNRLVQINSSLVVLKYDALGRRIEKDSLGITNLYAHLEGNETAEAAFSSSPEVPFASYVWGNGLLLEMTGTNGQRYFYHPDHLGSPVAITDTNRIVAESYDNDDYGMPTNAYSILGSQFRYRANRYDPETEFYLLGNGYLDPKAGRLISRKPTGDCSLGNLFTFAQNDPLSGVAPGLQEGPDIDGPQPGDKLCGQYWLEQGRKPKRKPLLYMATWRPPPPVPVELIPLAPVTRQSHPPEITLKPPPERPCCTIANSSVVVDVLRLEDGVYVHDRYGKPTTYVSPFTAVQILANVTCGPCGSQSCNPGPVFAWGRIRGEGDQSQFAIGMAKDRTPRVNVSKGSESAILYRQTPGVYEIQVSISCELKPLCDPAFRITPIKIKWVE